LQIARNSTPEEQTSIGVNIELFDDSGAQITSIFRTCRQLHSVARPLLAPSSLLHSASTSTMLDTVTTLARSISENLQHMRLKACPFPIVSNENHTTTFEMASTLTMMPGLQLDILIVEDAFHNQPKPFDWLTVGPTLISNPY